MKSILLLLILIGFSSAAFAQRGGDPRLRYGELLYAEAACFPSDSTGFARIDVFVRVTYDFMIFTRSASMHPDSLYTGGVEVSCSIRKDGTSLRSSNSFEHVAVADYDDTNMRDRYVLVRQTFYLPPGKYETAVFVSDMGSTRRNTIVHEVKATLFAAPSRQIGQPIPLTRETGHRDAQYGVLGYGRTFAFSQPSIIGIPVPRDFTAHWYVKLQRSGENPGTALFDDLVQPIAQLNGLLPSSPAGRVPDFALQVHEDAIGDMVVLSPPFKGYDVGPYLLTVTAVWDAGRDSITIPVRILWRDMPFSLRDLDFAIDAMRFILTEEEYKRMKRGSEQERNRAFRAYWKERDITPETEHNEMMTEYFRRVDEAYYEFQTLYIRNGVQTDRGKVYVLFGPPEDTQRILNRDEPVTEIWYYPSLGKTFQFVDRDRDGNLKLMED